MKQVLRLMGMPDKVIAFDELPADLLEGLEMHDESKMPRHWREFFGIRTKRIDIKPYFDGMTRSWIKCDPILQTGPFSWLIDWEINSNKERWQEIDSYVKRNAPKDFRLLDKLEDMAKPLAPNPQSEITLEPEEVLVIPLAKEVKEIESATVMIAPKLPETQTAMAPVTTVTVIKEEPKVEGTPVATPPEIVENKAISAPNPEPEKPVKRKNKEKPQPKDCDVCGKKFDDGRGFANHMRIKHGMNQPVPA